MLEIFTRFRNWLWRTDYRLVLKPIFFKFDPEYIHNNFISFGHFLGKCALTRSIIGFLLNYQNPSLAQNIGGINFRSPIGLAAGFDYEANLMQILPKVGFGFETIGTITNGAYGGNEKPRLGRLVKSRSLLVNKGFKNLGMEETLKKLVAKQYEIPIGLSIGVTNTTDLKNQEDAVRDIVRSFEAAENSKAPFSYYEFNISCPNLKVAVEFYSPDHLDEALKAITQINLSKPLFIKMPIEKTDEDVLSMLDIISKYPVSGVIFGNLQKNRQDPALDPREIEKCSKGNFSGKPTEKRSNELIALAYKAYGEKLIIIGCGGIFSAEDAYKKIKAGATLIQMITGMIFEGPQIISDINIGLVELLEKDGYKNISEAIGKGN